MKAEILSLLRESTDYISGQELCERFGVSRTAVWKAVNQLKKEGYEIRAVSNKGYKLIQEPDILSENEIKSRLQTKWAGNRICYFDLTDSTNQQARLLAEQGAEHGTVVVADRQTAGRGRRGRQWDSPPGTNIYFTLLLRPEFHPSKASMLTILMALAVAKGIEETGVEGVSIKWPNDVLLNGRKVCGILTEMSAEPDGINHVVIGTGINTGPYTFPEELQDKATAIANETGRKVNRAELLQKVLQQFETVYEEFCRIGNLSYLIADYEKRLVNKDREVKVLDPKGEYAATAKGITENGELVVIDESGEERQIYAGEVSVRGIYGYV